MRTSVGLTNPMTAAADLIVGGAAGITTRLPKGTALQILRVDAGATALEWATISGTGDVTAAANFAVDNVIVKSDGILKGVQATGIVIDDTTNAIHPSTDDAGVLGTALLSWSDLFLASAAVINFNNGNVTLTHSAGVLTLSGSGAATLALGTNSITMSGSIGVTGTRVTKLWATDIESTNMITIGGTSLSSTFAAVAQTMYIGTTQVAINRGSAALVLTGITSIDGSSASCTGNAATVTISAEATDTSCFVLFATATTGSLSPSTHANLTFNSNTGVFTSASLIATTADINGGTIDGTSIGASSASTIIGTTIQANTGFVPDANDGAYLGTTALSFSDLFLADGAVINFNNGNATLTHAAGSLTVGGSGAVVLALGTNSLTMSGSIAATGARVTKGWFTDLEVTNSPSVNGTAISAIYLALAGGTLTGEIDLGENAGLKLDALLSADGKYSGIVEAGIAGATIAFGDLCYLDPTDSRWELADANVITSADGDCRGTLGLCVLAGNDGDATKMLLWGKIRAATFPAFTINETLYVSETAGDVTHTQPTTADVAIRVVGVALTAEDMLFNPSPDYITHT